MKYFYLCCLLIFSLSANAQSSYYISAAPGNWNTATNWNYYNGTTLLSPAPNAPDSNADMVFVGHNMISYAAVYVKKVSFTAGNSLAYAPMHLTSSGGNQIEIQSGASFLNYNTTTKLPYSGTATIQVDSNATFILRGTLDSTVIVNNNGTILCNGSGQFNNDGIINNYNFFTWTSTQGANSQDKNGTINNYDTLRMSTAGSSSTFAYFTAQAINNFGTLLVDDGSASIYLQPNNSNGAYGSTTFTNSGNVIVNSGRLLINCASVINNTSTTSIANNGVYYMTNTHRHTFNGGQMQGAGDLFFYGTTFVQNNPLSISVDSVILNSDTLSVSSTFTLNSQHARWLSGNVIGSIVNNGKLSMTGSGSKKLVGRITNNNEFFFNGTNLSSITGDSARIVNNSVMATNAPQSQMNVQAFIHNKGSWYLDFDYPATNNEFYFNGANSFILNDTNGHIHLKNKSRFSHTSGTYGGLGKLSIDSNCQYSYTANQAFNYQNDSLNIFGRFDNYTPTAALYFNGSNPSYINSSQQNSTTNQSNISYLQINNAANVYMNGHIKTRNISFTNGKLFTNGHNIYATFFSSTGADTSQYIVNHQGGFFIRLSQSQNTLIPVGTPNFYAPIELTQQLSTANYYKVRVQDSVYDAYTNEVASGSAVTLGAVNHTWYIQPWNTTASAALTGTTESMGIRCYYQNNVLPNFNPVNTRMCHYVGGQWTYDLAVNRGSAAGLSYTGYNVNQTSLSPFAVSSGPLPSNAPLPIHLLNFSGIPQTTANALNWISTNERNNDYFTLLHSTDGLSFSEITQINSKNLCGSSNSQTEYSYHHTNPHAGHNYYKLISTDIDGTSYTHKIIDLYRQASSNEVLGIYPNPATHFIKLRMHANTKAPLRILIKNINGQIMQQSEHKTQKGLNSFQIDLQEIASGFYFIETQIGSQLLKTIKMRKM